ncbi:CU044_5270 family protein [Actinocorallia libanotica]|uniref:CU044_5270 family protein n=1 Tax=Actinocorallia libanotica TaxID=46162 RepID=A0ABN1QA90_9ACTN
MTDEIQLFRDARPEAAPYDPFSKARARARLLTEDAPAPRRRFRWVFATSIATAGALVGGLFFLNTTEPTGTGPETLTSSLQPMSAADYLEKAARIVEQRPETRPQPHQWLYEKKYLKDSDGHMDQFHETWKRMDGQQASSQQDRDGKPIIDGPYLGRNERTPLQKYDHLRTLSTDPDKLFVRTYKKVDKLYAERRAAAERLTDPVYKEMELSELTEDGRHQKAFHVIAELFEGVLTPPRLHAAAFRAIAKVPGVQVLPGNTDLLGRPVMTIARVNEYGSRYEYLVDPLTYASRGVGSVVVRDDVGPRYGGASRGEDGKITPIPAAKKTIGQSFYEIRERAGIVDEVGRVPR